MTKIKVENKSRKQTVKVNNAGRSAMKAAKTEMKSQSTAADKSHATKSPSQGMLSSRIDDLEAKVGDLMIQTKANQAMIQGFGKLEDKMYKSVSRLSWGLFIVFVLFVIVFGIVLN